MTTYNDTMTEAELQDGTAAAAQYAGWKVMHVRPARTADGGWRTPVQYDGRGWPDLFMAQARAGCTPRKLGRRSPPPLLAWPPPRPRA